MPHTVFLVEDDEPTRTRLARAIREQPELRLLAAVGTCAEARTQLTQQAPDVLLADLGLPDGRGADLIYEVSRAHPHTQSMVITVFGDEQHVVDAIAAGATGYLLKDASAGEIAQAILELLAGGSPISPAVARYLLKRFQSPAAAQPLKPQEPQPSRFTDRETEVLHLVAKGLAYSEISHALTISANTVGSHIKQIYRKLAVNSRGEAVFEATALGLLTLPTGQSPTHH